jgi:DNA-binding MarR family transcriptional regulator
LHAVQQVSNELASQTGDRKSPTRSAPYRSRRTELYRSLIISSGGLTDRLARLEAAGFVRRIASKDDARSILVGLTPSGRRRAEAALREDMAVEKALLERLTTAECERLAALLSKLAASLEVPDA